MDLYLNLIADQFQELIEHKRWTAFHVSYVPTSTGDRAQLFQAIELKRGWEIQLVRRPLR